ncbi:unnamed protein product [Pedinophyceae sp. YPF-701]|nr:unnamed protein product [Pedinophyceae sp. YPF-701]
MSSEKTDALRKKHKDNMVWIPRRCEAAGCDAREGLRKCTQCTCVMYCSKECQKSDWERHREECKHISKLGVLGIPFADAEMLARQPLRTAATQQRPAPADTRPRECGICGSAGPLARTPCCGEWVCDRQEHYVPGSYSRAFCDRSHRRYSVCGNHWELGHAGDWRTCEECRRRWADPDRPRDWHTTNGYCFVPALEEWYPRGQMLTLLCYSWCDNRIFDGFENCADHGENAEGEQRIICRGCADHFPGGVRLVVPSDNGPGRAWPA